jgi:hypothetical protein
MINQARLRTILRWGHIVGGMFLVACVYSGSRQNVDLTNIARFVVVPLIVLSGLWLWQQGRIVRWMRRTPSQTSTGQRATVDRRTFGMTPRDL